MQPRWRRALRGVDAVVNCVAGDAASIAEGAQVLAQAAIAAGCPRIVHLSSMSVYGAAEGRVDERAPLDPSLGWYARAKCEAERHVAVIRAGRRHGRDPAPGLRLGPRQPALGRAHRPLAARRPARRSGHRRRRLVQRGPCRRRVQCHHRVACASCNTGDGVRTYNLAAPDSPRWNEYFVDLALAIGATPVRRIAPRQLRTGRMAGRAAAESGPDPAGPPGPRFRACLPDPLPPGLLGLWERHLLLDASAATQALGMEWTPYAEALKQSAAWFVLEESRAATRAPGVMSTDPHAG